MTGLDPYRAQPFRQGQSVTSRWVCRDTRREFMEQASCREIMEDI